MAMKTSRLSYVFTVFSGWKTTACHDVVGWQWRWSDRIPLGRQGPFHSKIGHRLHQGPERIRVVVTRMTSKGHGEDDWTYYRHRYFKISFGCVPSGG
ncbi:hypothetical protein ACQU0X_02195 [Pseudovibrio ascidiaceicola]|uniref:hypothetical protein n=1 Tax=Pseudovibrio ascidiaceicola TaxID=285279 RepID=UPI003D35F5DD